MAELKKYKYIWKEHTMIKLTKNLPKVRIESWEVVCSEVEIKNTYFEFIPWNVEEIKFEDKREEVKVEQPVSIKGNLIKQYIEKFGKRPSPRWTEEELLAKLS